MNLLEPFVLTGGEHHFDLSFDAMELGYPDATFENVAGKWDFTFTVDGDAMTAETVTYSVGKEIVLDNGDVIRLGEIVCSPVSQTLMFTVVPFGSILPYDVIADATDDLGGNYRFIYIESSMVDGCISGRSVNESPDAFSPDAESITLNVTVCDRMGEVLAKNIEVVAYKE